MSSDPIDLVARLHAAVDIMMEPHLERHAARLQCGLGCTTCCRDNITVLEVEAERIRRDHAELLQTAEPHPEGACAFLGEQGACRIYEARPYVCRTHGLPLRWLEVRQEQIFEFRDICPLNEDPQEPLGELEEDACWLIGPVEDRLASLQEVFGEEGARISLRDLLERS